MITSNDVALVQKSWKHVKPISNTAAELFYGKLFSLDPAIQSLFKGDMKEQGTKLMTMITTAVNGLSRLEAIVPAVQALGRRHRGYGVKPQHYETVGTALLWTLGHGLGEEFTPEVERAWIATYGVLAKTMKDAAAS